jgi:hypothetical protein
MTDREAAALEAGLAEIDNRLFAVIDDALADSGAVVRPWHWEITAERIARAVWAWLAQGDE